MSPDAVELLLVWVAATAAALVHEAAHAAAAVALRLQLSEVRVGLGPGWTRTVRLDGRPVRICLGILPVAGWCRVEQLASVPPGQRVVLWLAGPAANLAAAIVMASAAPPRGGPLWGAAIIQLAVAITSLAPVPGMDGWGALRAVLELALSGSPRRAAVGPALSAIAATQATVLVAAGTAAVAQHWVPHTGTVAAWAASSTIVLAVLAAIAWTRHTRRT